MKLTYRRKLIILAFLILVAGALAMGVWTGVHENTSITWEALRYLTMPTPILLMLIMAAIFALAGREKE